MRPFAGFRRGRWYASIVRAAALCVLVLLAAALEGCPRDVEEPETPEGVLRCESLTDCNAATCGALRACVGGLCEAPDAGTLVIPCIDGSVTPTDGGGVDGGDADGGD